MKKRITWAFAVAFNDQIHIISHAMPPAENLVNVNMWNDDGMWIIDAEDAKELRALLGQQSIKEVVRHVGPDVANEFEDLLDGIVQLIDRRVAQLRGDIDEDLPTPP